MDFARLTRHVFASSSCGVCGLASIEAVHKSFSPVESNLKVQAKLLLDLPAKLRAAQPAFDRTGGLHGAGLFSAKGEPVVIREDIGRHNAVDKVLGHALFNGLIPLHDHLLIVSGRASFEVVQKASAAGVAVIASVSAASSLAVDLARASGITLCGFARGGSMTVYSHAERIRLENP